MIVPRPGLRDVAPYESYQFDVEARLNTNECPYPLPDGFGDDLAKAVRDLSLNRYPDREAEALRAGLADVADHPFEGTWAANGSNEILLQLLQAYGGPGRRVVVFEPTYALHSRLAWVTRSDVLRYGRAAVEDRRAPRRRGVAGRSIGGVRVLTEQPNGERPARGDDPRARRPRDHAGRCRRGLHRVRRRLGRATRSTPPEPGGRPNVLEGLRARRRSRRLLPRVARSCRRPPASSAPVPSELAQPGSGARGPRPPGGRGPHPGRRPRPRDRILATLPSMGAEAFPSSANFVLFRPPRHAREVWRGLLDRGVLVRDLTELVPECLRVTAGTPEEVDLFLSALEEVLT